MFNEWWIDPDLLPTGSVLLNNEFRVQLVNGVWGNGTDDYPYYEVVVQPGKCYRLRWIAAMGEDVGELPHPAGLVCMAAMQLPVAEPHLKITCWMLCPE